MDIEDKLQRFIDRAKDAEGRLGTESLTKLIFSNQIAIMEYLQKLGKIQEQNTIQQEYLVEAVNNIDENVVDLFDNLEAIEEILDEITDCNFIVVEEDTSKN